MGETIKHLRAGLSFKGQMQQNFVLLNDKGVRVGGKASGGGGLAGQPQGQPGSNKRQREVGNGSGTKAKKQMGGPFKSTKAGSAPGKN